MNRFANARKKDKIAYSFLPIELIYPKYHLKYIK